MPVLRVGIEHVDQGLFGETGDLLLYGLCIPNGVALRQCVVGLSRSRRGMMEEGELLLRDAPIAS